MVRIGVPVAALALGVAVGLTMSDPTASAEYQDAADEVVTLTKERDELTSANTDLGREKATLENQITALEGRVGALEEEVAGVAEREEAVAASEVELAQREDAVTQKEASVSEREDAVGIAESTAAANTFGAGTYTVGVDITSGMYRTTEAVSSMCYWGITRTGSNGSDIIENDIVEGGFPQVTLAEGQTFESSRCGSWTKQ